MMTAASQSHGSFFKRKFGDVKAEQQPGDEVEQENDMRGRRYTNGRKGQRTDDSDHVGGNISESAHQALSEAGRKGAEARWGRQYSVEDGEDAGRQRNGQGGRKHGNDDISERAHRALSEAGRKGAAVRWGKDGGDDLSRATHEALSEAGRKGAAVRWGLDRSRPNDAEDFDTDSDYEPGQSGDLSHAFSYEKRAATGSKGARAGLGNRYHDAEQDEDDTPQRTRRESFEEFEDNPEELESYRRHAAAGHKGAMARMGRQSDIETLGRRRNTSDENTHRMRQAAGRKGAAARWGRNHSDAENEDSGEDGRSDTSTTQSRNQATGRKISATHWGRNYHEAEGQDTGRRNMSRSTHQKLSEAGRKGAAARWGRKHSAEDNDEDMNDGRRRHVSEAGRKGAAARWGSRHDQDDDEDEDHGAAEDEGMSDDRSNRHNVSESTHKKLSQAGRKGAQARWGRNYGNDDQLSSEEEDQRSNG